MKLSGIDKIDWSRLTPGVIPPVDTSEIPTWLRNLTVSDKELREDAFRHILSATEHQGIIWEAAAYVIPFLIELLSYEETPERARILSLIDLLADSTAIHQGGDKYERWAKEAHRAAGEGIDLYLQLLNDRDRGVRMQSIYVLSLFPDHATRTVPEILEALSRETPSRAKADAIWAVGNLIVASDRLPDDGINEYAGQIEGLLEESKDDAVRLITAATIVNMLKGKSPRKIVRMLVDQLSDPDSYKDLLWPGGELVYDLSRKLSRIGIEEATEALAEALANTPKVEDGYTIAGFLLDVVFDQQFMHAYSTHPTKDKEGNMVLWHRPVAPSYAHILPLTSPPDHLTTHQQLVLNTILAREDMWQVRSNLLELYGLPNSREEIRQLVSPRG
jgi:hypothetical protein